MYLYTHTPPVYHIHTLERIQPYMHAPLVCSTSAYMSAHVALHARTTDGYHTHTLVRMYSDTHAPRIYSHTYGRARVSLRTRATVCNIHTLVRMYSYTMRHR